MNAPHSKMRRGFTLVETIVSLAVLSGAAVLVAQLATWSLTDRARTDARLEAINTAENVLEEARALPWKDLSAEWASGRKVPENIAARWPDCRMSVKVEAEKDRPQLKRVSVEVKWENAKWPPVKLTGLFADRAKEAKP